MEEVIQSVDIRNLAQEAARTVLGFLWNHSLRKGWQLEDSLRSGSHELCVADTHSGMLEVALCSTVQTNYCTLVSISFYCFVVLLLLSVVVVIMVIITVVLVKVSLCSPMPQPFKRWEYRYMPP